MKVRTWDGGAISKLKLDRGAMQRRKAQKCSGEKNGNFNGTAFGKSSKVL